MAWVDLTNGAPAADMKSKLITLINTGPGLKKDKNSNSCTSLRSESGKTYVKSILKGSNRVTIISEDDNTNTRQTQKTNETLTSLNFENKSNISSQKKFESSLSSKEGKSTMSKSHSVSVLDRAPASTNIEGNIIHITVNNFINTPSGKNNTNSSNQEESKPLGDKPKKTGLAMSSSQKDFHSLLKASKESEKQQVETRKRGYSPSSSLLASNILQRDFNILDERGQTRPNFSATFTGGDTREDNNPIFATRIKVNNFTNEPRKLNTSSSFTSSTGLSLNSLKNPSYKSYAAQSIVNQKTSSVPDKRYVDSRENARPNEKPLSMTNSGSNFFKYMNPGRGAPIR